MENSKIYYSTNCYFKIYPHKDDKIFPIEMNKYINNLMNNYKYNDKCLFFWKYDMINNKLIINEHTEYSENDIFIQFIQIADWIYKKGYSLYGIFFCRTQYFIEYIYASIYNKHILHSIIYDNLDINYLINKYNYKGDPIKIILYDALIKIYHQTYNNNLLEDDNNFLYIKNKFKMIKNKYLTIFNVNLFIGMINISIICSFCIYKTFYMKN